jgi:CDGSH-type Zn-finger protein
MAVEETPTTAFGRAAPEARIKVTDNGPLEVAGAPLVRIEAIYNEHGDGIRWERGPDIQHEESYQLCRCGASKNKPFCDGSEKDLDFDGTETADRRPSAERRKFFSEAPIALTDDRKLCAHQAFCERFPRNAWSVARGDQSPEDQDLLMYMVRRCPSGRLQVQIPAGAEPYEEDLPTEIAVVNDGPYWVRGGIPVESVDGVQYEVRNRQALCRCGQSGNKPFCDGTHWKIEFKDP